MKTIIASIVMMLMFSIASFSQNATINGTYCSTAPACPMYVCQNSSTTITAGITSGSIDSLKLRQRYSDDGGITWTPTTWAIISTTTVTTVPSGGSAVAGRIYQYWLRVYQGGNQYWAFSEMYVNAAPAATLLSNYTACCAGTTVTFTASAGGTNYAFKVNGATVQNGASSSYATSSLANGDIVTVTITNGSCVATSAPITMTIYPIPSATVVTGNVAAVCVGQNAPVTITGLTGTGPWTLEIWNTTGGVPTSLYYTVPGSIATPNTTINVPIPLIGLTNEFLRVTDSHMCSNH